MGRELTQTSVGQSTVVQPTGASPIGRLRSMIGVPLSRAISTFAGFIMSLIEGKSLTERTVTVPPDPQESASAGTDNIDTMIEQNPGQLAQLLIDNKSQTNDWKPDQFHKLAMKLAENEMGGVDLLEQLIDEKKLQTNDWKPDQFHKLAIALAINKNYNNKYGSMVLLEQLIKDGKLENFKPQELSSEDANKFAIALVRAGKEGATLLATLIEKGQLQIDGWGPVQRYKLAIRLAKAGKEGATPLATLIEKGQLQIDGWGPVQRHDLAMRLAYAGKEGATPLATLIEKDQLQIDGWDENQCYRLVSALADAEKEGAKVLGLLIEKGQLKTDGWNALQCNRLVGALAKAGKEGAKWLGLLIKDDKLKNLTLNPEQCNELAAALVEKDPILLARLLRDNLQGLTLDEMQCNTLAMKLIVAGSTGPHCLSALLMKDKLQQFRLLGCNGTDDSRTKALELLSGTTPNIAKLAELKSLIDIGLKNRLIYVAKSNITKLRGLIDTAGTNITESKNSIMDKLNGLIGGIKSWISNHSDPEPDEGIELDDDII